MDEIPPAEFDTESYRSTLVSTWQASQTSFDTVVVSVSGGAIGLSLALLKDAAFAKSTQAGWVLLLAWVCWAVSVASTLWSFHTSAQAMRHALRALDNGKLDRADPGGRFDRLTDRLNWCSAIAFFVGLLAMVAFVGINMAANQTLFRHSP